ncbi:protein piccolo-like [Orbicella faveolata]|uniref:protein piccolo-like n=1 Tax=Orbicella faveolata TaxID=48498 RepID=UPI0009E4347B|nr:protein piccolo-like [Orbicella faveolata]
MEGNGDLMKMLMHADHPDENIQGPMEDTAMVQTGAYPQTGMPFGAGHYASMQQQLPTMSPQRQQQQQRSSGYPTITPGQMRSPNNGMMQPDMDLVLHQQQYQQQPQQYGNGNYQGYNGGYQGPRPVSSQTHSQTMSPYQTGFPSETVYPPGASGSQTMGEFGPQAGPNQSLGMAGPASLSLAAMSNRQQYYSDGYGMNQPVSPVHKQMPQGGGFLQPSGLPYSQQVPTYHSGSYPKRPPSSPVQTQMQGFSSGGSSYAPRSNAGMQMPNMPYQSSTNPYQPPHSPSRRSSSTSPVPQQDPGLYSRPHEPFPQPRSPFGPSQAHFQQQQLQQQSSCMFVQPSTTLPQSHYQSQQLMGGTKTGGLTQRRASYPGQQNTLKMPSPPLKRSPPSKAPSPNPKSPDATRAGQLGFEERGSTKKPVAKKEKASSPRSSDPSEGILETTGTVSNAVQCSFKQKPTASKKVGEGQKGVPRQRRSASDADRPSVSPPTIKKDCTDGNKSKTEEKTRDKRDAFKNVEGLDKAETAERKSNEQNGSNRITKTEALRRQGGQEEISLQSSSVSKEDESCGNVGEDQSLSEVNRTKPDKGVGEDTTSKASLLIANISEERKESETVTAETGESDSNVKDAIRESDKSNASPTKKVESNVKDEVLASEATEKVKETLCEGSDISSGKNVYCKEGESSSKVEHQRVNKESEAANPEKNVKADDKSQRTGAETTRTSSVTDKAEDKTNKADSKTGETIDTFGELDSKSAQNVSELGTTSQLSDEAVDSSINAGRETGKLDKTGEETNRDTPAADVDNTNTVGEDKERDLDDKTNKITTKDTEEPEKLKELVSKEKVLAEKDEASNKADACEGSGEAKEELPSKSSDAEQAVKVQKKEGKPAVPSLRCEERLSSDDDDRLLHKTPEKSESGSAPVVENRTLGIQTVQQPTATARTTQQQAAPIKATIIAKGKSSQNNQQVMVAKTTSGQMYLIQGNILVPVQTVSSKDDASKQNPQLIIVNPVKTGSGQQGANKQLAAATKGDDGNEASKERKDERVQTGNSQGSRDDKASKSIVSVKEKADTESPSGNKKSHETVQKPERPPNSKMTVKIEKLPTSKVSKMSPTQAEKSDITAAKEKQNNNSESPRGKHDPDSKTPNKHEEKSSPSEQTNQGSTPKLPRGRPVGSKDKQKRKSYVHKVKRKQDEMEIEELNAQELAAKRKFSKTAVAVQEMSSSGASSAASKRPLEVPTVSASKSPKKRKVSTSSSPVKHISTRPRGGIDGDSWVCSLCGKGSGYNLLGDLYGPYKTKFSKEKTDSTSKEGKQSQKLSSPGRKSSSSSDVQLDGETCDVDLWIHRDCGVWSPGVFMLGRTIHGLEQAVESAAQHKCTKCSELGATLACFKRGCNKMFHYACARDSGCSFIEDNFTIFCSTHK